MKPNIRILPAEQELPASVPDDGLLTEVRNFVVSHGMAVPPHEPQRIAIAGEFMDYASLREGRVGMHRNLRVVSFLRRYSGQPMKAIVVIPREGIDARMLGLAIFLGQVADVPESVAQTEIVSVTEFFNISTFDLSKVLDVPSLERFKADYKKSVDAELRAAVQRYKTAEAKLAKLAAARKGGGAAEERVPPGRPPRKENAMLPRMIYSTAMILFFLFLVLIAYLLR